MKIAFRVDASSQIGTGHVMRCLALADVLAKRGAKIRFVVRHLPDHLAVILRARGHQYATLDRKSSAADLGDLPHAQWLGTSQRADAEESIEALSGEAWDWLIVDHYALDARWESALRQTANGIFVVDDLANRQHDCDGLLDQNVYSDMAIRYIGRVPAHCRLLIGPRYALVGDEFRRLHEQVQPRTASVRRMLLFFGGTDANDYTSRAIEGLATLGIEGLHVDVVIGGQHPNRKQIEAACAKHRFECHVQTSRMAELMAAADLAIGAGGSAIWERCCLGLPTFSICTADNQVRQIADAASRGLLYAPELRDDLTNAIARHLAVLMENGALRQCISRNAMEEVDGRGVLRVIGALGCSGIEIRVAGMADAKRVFEWRNHPTIRAASRNKGVLDWQEHQEWFASAVTDPMRILLIGQREGMPLGVVRFDTLDFEAEVSIYVDPGAGEFGWGRDLLESAERWLTANRPGTWILRANVLGNNEPSRRLFLGSGYRVESSSYLKTVQ